jgi:hypothetical protein
MAKNQTDSFRLLKIIEIEFTFLIQPARKFPRRLNIAKLIRTTASINSRSIQQTKNKFFNNQLSLIINLLGRKKLGVTLCT